MHRLIVDHPNIYQTLSVGEDAALAELVITLVYDRVISVDYYGKSITEIHQNADTIASEILEGALAPPLSSMQHYEIDYDELQQWIEALVLGVRFTAQSPGLIKYCGRNLDRVAPIGPNTLCLIYRG